MLQFNSSGAETRVKVEDKQIVVCSESQCRDLLEANRVARDMRQSMRGTQRHWQRIADIPAEMYHREVRLPSQGQRDLADDLTFRLLKRYPYLRTTEGRIGPKRRHV